MHLYHTVFAVRLSLLSFAVTALLPSQCCHHVAVTLLTFHNQTVKLQSVTDDSKFIFLFIGESISSTYKCNISFLLIGLWMQSCLFIPIELRTERNIKSVITIRRLSSRQCRGPFRHPFNNAESLLCKFRMSGT